MKNLKNIYNFNSFIKCTDKGNIMKSKSHLFFNNYLVTTELITFKIKYE